MDATRIPRVDPLGAPEGRITHQRMSSAIVVMGVIMRTIMVLLFPVLAAVKRHDHVNVQTMHRGPPREKQEHTLDQ